MIGRGKLVGLALGLLAGLLTRRPWLIVIGLALGHLYDIGVFGRRSTPPSENPAPPAVDPYAVLGVEPDASDEEVEQAWRRRMSEYHPDRVANAAREIRELADLRAREANAAWESIRRLRGH